MGKYECNISVKMFERCSSQRDCKRKPYRIAEMQRHDVSFQYANPL